MKTTCSTISILLAIAFSTLGPNARAGETEWSTELGFLAGYHDNYFFRDESGSTPDETFLTVYGKGDVEFDAGPGDLKILGGASGAFGLELPKTDYQVAFGGLQYKWGRTRTGVRYTRTQDKVFGEEDDASLFNVDAAEVTIRQNLGGAFRAQLGFELENWDFSSSDNDRDALKYEPELMLRWEICDCVALRSSFIWTIKDADAERYDYDGPGFSVAAELSPVDPVDMFLRYRMRWRSYDNANVGDSNHDRDDTIYDVIANTRWMLTDFFGLQLTGMYRHGDSNRSDRNYDAFSATGGFFVAFGSPD